MSTAKKKKPTQQELKRRTVAKRLAALITCTPCDRTAMAERFERYLRNWTLFYNNPRIR